MVSGSVTSDSLRDVLRSLSIKRRNGILGVVFEGQELELSFIEGKIIRAQSVGKSPAVEVCARLVSAGCLANSILEPIREAGISLTQLYELLIGKNYVTHEEFIRAKRGYEYDLLHSLRTLTQGKAQFSPKVIRSDPRQSIAVYPGQLLLDFAELSGDEGRFTDIFEADEVWIERAPSDGDRAAHEAEQVVLDLCVEGCTYGELSQRCLLSRYELVQTLLALYEQKLIKVRVLTEAEAQELQYEEPAEHFGSPAEHFEGPAQHFESPAQHFKSTAGRFENPADHSGNTADSEAAVPMADLVNQAVRQLQEFHVGADEDTLASPLVDAGEPQFELPELSDFERSEAPMESDEEDDSVYETADAVEELPVRGVTARYKALNYFLLDPKVARSITFVVTMAMLAIFALFGSAQFEQFFKALRSFR